MEIDIKSLEKIVIMCGNQNSNPIMKDYIEDIPICQVDETVMEAMQCPYMGRLLSIDFEDGNPEELYYECLNKKPKMPKGCYDNFNMGE